MLLTLFDNCWTSKEPDNYDVGACIDPLVATLVRQVAWFFRGCRGLCYAFNAIGFIASFFSLSKDFPDYLPPTMPIISVT